MIKNQNKAIIILSDNELIKIFNYFDINTFVGARDLFIFSIMLDCGLRLSEVANLRYIDFDFYNNIIKVNGKGQKQRYVPFSDTLKITLCYYIKFCKNYKNGKLLKFENGLSLTSNDIVIIFKKISKKLNISIHPHLLRHTFAIRFLVNGGDIENLRLILGHDRYYMCKNYLNFVKNISKEGNKKWN